MPLFVAVALLFGALGLTTSCAKRGAGGYLAAAGLVVAGGGAAGLALKGANHMPVGPVSILGIVGGGVLMLAGLLSGVSFVGGH